MKVSFKGAAHVPVHLPDDPTSPDQPINGYAERLVFGVSVVTGLLHLSQNQMCSFRNIEVP